MGQYSDEERGRILLEARANIAQCKAARVGEENGDRAVRSYEEDPVERWKREADEAEARRARERVMTTDELNRARTRDWEKWADRRIARAIERERTDILKAAGQAVGMIRKQLRDEFAEQIGLLRAELAAKAHAALKSGDVIDLPHEVVRKVRDAS